MSDPKPHPGAVLWRDLTVPNADEIRSFYAQVVGWTAAEHPMGEHSDYEMKTADGQTVAGICHARGSNANVPPQWLVYVAVESVERSARRCIELGGRVVDGPRPMGAKPFCIVQDPAGAVLALIEA